EFPVREVVLLERVLEALAAALLGALSGLTAEPLANLVAGARRSREREPIARRAAPRSLRREDLDEVSALQAVVQRDDASVHFRAHRAVADVGVHRIGEVDRRRA